MVGGRFLCPLKKQCGHAMEKSINCLAFVRTIVYNISIITKGGAFYGKSSKSLCKN